MNHLLTPFKKQQSLRYQRTRRYKDFFKPLGLLSLFLLLSRGSIAQPFDSYSISPYLWTPELYFDLGPINIERSSRNLIDALDGIFLLKGSLYKGPWAANFDFNYFDISAAESGVLKVSSPINGRNFTIGSSVDLTAKIVFIDLALAHSLYESSHNNLFLHSGYRLLNLIPSSNLVISTPNKVITTEIPIGFYNSNAFWGFNGTYSINKDWEALYLADVGRGESKLTKHLEGGLAIKKSWGRIFFSYRYLSWNKAGPFDKFKLNGVVAGITI